MMLPVMRPALLALSVLRPARFDARMSASSVSAVDEFNAWMQTRVPAGHEPRKATVVTIDDSSVEGVLAVMWSRLREPELDSLTVLLMPHAPALRDATRMRALSNHLKTCRDSCARFGAEVRLQSLHPSDEMGPPHPMYMLSTRVGPQQLQADDPEEEVEKARLSLEGLLADAPPAVEAPPPRPTAEAALEHAQAWFEQYYGRVARAVGSRLRKTAVPGEAGEDVYCTFWREAAALRKALSAPADDAPLSSLLVLTADAWESAEEFRKLTSSLQLGLAVLGLEKEMRITAIVSPPIPHPPPRAHHVTRVRCSLTAPARHVRVVKGGGRQDRARVGDVAPPPAHPPRALQAAARRGRRARRQLRLRHLVGRCGRLGPQGTIHIPEAHQ